MHVTISHSLRTKIWGMWVCFCQSHSASLLLRSLVMQAASVREYHCQPGWFFSAPRGQHDLFIYGNKTLFSCQRKGQMLWRGVPAASTLPLPETVISESTCWKTERGETSRQSGRTTCKQHLANRQVCCFRLIVQFSCCLAGTARRYKVQHTSRRNCRCFN